ncbi:MAG: class I SAM-dependent methyltransferase [Ignavibacteriae bacterium]|nr:MAG: class I SAM-dependent methyltransferase [Ignavibacteriota bacterium]
MDFEEKIGTTFLDYTRGGVYNIYHQYSHEKAINRLLPEMKNLNVLDLGCAGGTYYELLKNKGFKSIYGLDLSNERLSEAEKKGYITINSNAENIPLDTASMDAVICIDMLVHVLKRENRNKIFGEVNRVLKNNGYFVFSIPSKKAYVYGNYGVTKEEIYKDADGIINDYCCLIDFEEIKNYSNEFGFIIEKIAGTQFDLKAFRLIRRLLKEPAYYKSFLPLLDVIWGKTFLKPLGKAVFFRFKKK